MNKLNITFVTLLIIALVGGVFVYLIIDNSKENIENISNCEILIKIEATGGLCPYGECNSELIIFNNGFYNSSTNNKQEKVGNLDEIDLLDLKQLIKNSNFKDIKSKPFTGTCPIAYDGQEDIYTFFFDKGTESISDCNYELNYDEGLFAKLIEIKTIINS